MDSSLPAGTVTFLFTDIAGSTQLLQRLGSERYGELLASQRRILRTAFEAHNGREVDTQGDSFFASFPRASDAVNAVVQIQRELAAHKWPDDAEVRVRMGLHTGEPWLVDEGYVGMDVHRAARIAHCGHGGQVLLSQTTTPLVEDDLPDGVELVDLGRHRLKDVRRPERLHQLAIRGLPTDFPSLKSLEDLSAMETNAGTAARPPRQVGESPYRGLAAFQEADATFFFGREAFTGELLETLRQRHLVAVVVGSSGSGKSSAVFAGLLPRLRDQSDWLLVPLRPGAQPFLALAGALLPHLEPGLSETDQMIETRKMAAALSAGELAFSQVAARALAKAPGSERLLLVVDQFEELYTLCPDPDLREAFLDEMLAAVSEYSAGAPKSVAFVLTLRADFMGQALAHRPFADALQAGSLMLGPMNRGELQAAIEKPAELQGAAFDAGLVSRILEDVGEEPGNLPLLEFALTLLWERMDNGWLTHSVYDQIGRVEGALAKYADEVFEALTREEQEQARIAFVQLIQPGQGTEDTRRVARRADLVGVDWGLIQRLADKRLIVTGLDEAGKETVEVVHEALIRGWGQLRAWMNADRAFRTWQEGLRAAMRGWEASSRDDGALLRGGPLAQAEDWLKEREDEISESERNYIHASSAFQQQRQRQRERRRRLIVGGLAVGLVVAILLSVFAFSQQRIAQANAALAENSAATAQAEALARATQQVLAENEADARGTQQAIAEEARTRAEEEAQARATQQALAEEQANVATSRELAAAAINSLEVDPERGILLALAGLSHEYTSEAESALHQAIQASPLRRSFTNSETGSGSLAASPDRERLFVSGNRGGTMWDVPTGEVVFTHFTPDGTGIRRADFTPDGNLILLPGVSTDAEGNVFAGSVTILDAQTGQEVLRFSAHEAAIEEVAVSPDGKLFATISLDLTTKIWDLEATLAEGDGQILHDLCCLDSQEDIFVGFSPDGTRLVTANGNARIWDVSSGLELLTMGPDIQMTAYSPDGDYLVSISWDRGILQVWDAVTGERLSTTQVQDLSIPWDIQFGPDGNFVVIGHLSGQIHLFRFSPEEMQPHQTLLGHDDIVGGLAFSLDGKNLFSTSSDGTTRIWDISPSGSAEIGAIPASESVEDLIHDHARSTVITSNSDGIVRVLDANSLTEKFKFEAHQAEIRTIEMSPDGKMVATGDRDGFVKVWDIETWELMWGIEAHEPGTGFLRGVQDVDFSPDSSLLITSGADGMVYVWDIQTGGQVKILVDQGNPVLGTVFHPTEPWIATSYDTSIKILDLTSGELLQELVHDNWEIGNQGVWGHDISTNGTQLIAGRSDGAVEIWRLPAGNWQAGGEEALLVNDIRTEADLILAARFHPGREQYAISTLNGLIELRDSATKELKLSIQQPGGVRRLEFSPDGKRLYAVGLDGSVQVYVLDLQELIDLAYSRVTRSLTPEECQTYLHLDECPALP